MLRRTTYVGAVAIVLALLALTPGVAAAAAWLKSVQVHHSTDTAPSLAMDGSGGTLVAWQNSASPSIVVQGAHRGVGGGGFLTLSDFSAGLTLDNETPLVVSNRAGDSLVVWVHTTSTMGAPQEIRVASVKPDGSLAKPVEAIDTAGGSDSNLTAAINENGDAVIAWAKGSTIQASTRQGLGGSFGAEKDLDTAADGFPSAAIDGAGNTIVVWPHNNGAENVIEGNRHVAGQPSTTWATGEAPIDTGGHDYTTPMIAANPNGQIVVAFNDSVGSVISAISGTVSGGWGNPSPSPQVLSTTGVTHGPAVTVLDNGGAAVGWSTASAVEVSLRPPSQPFPSAASVKSIPVSTPDAVTLAGNGDGALVAAWYAFDTGAMHNVVSASVKPAGSPGFTTSQIISDQTVDSSFPIVSLDQSGDAVAGWTTSVMGTATGIDAAFYDATPPKLATITGPATVTTGVAASFSIPRPTDAFSAVPSINWSFGDGSAAATGLQASHTFSKAGAFAVSVTATDAAGNASTATLPITVTAGGANPPPPPGARCRVPKLKGKSLSQATTLLHRANCTVGKVTKPRARKHHKLRTLVVSSSSPGAGSVRAARTKVALRLVEAPKPKPKPKHKKH